jgi:DNA polymerase elongation subunit (family B)
LAVLDILARANTPQELADHLPMALACVEHAKRDLKVGHVPSEDLIVTQKLSRELDGYRTPSPAAHAAQQLQAAGSQVAPGQSMRFLYTRGRPGVHAWELPEALEPGRLDVKRYCVLLDRAMQTVLEPFQDLMVPAQRLL